MNIFDDPFYSKEKFFDTITLLVEHLILNPSSKRDFIIFLMTFISNRDGELPTVRCLEYISLNTSKILKFCSQKAEERERNLYKLRAGIYTIVNFRFCSQ